MGENKEEFEREVQEAMRYLQSQQDEARKKETFEREVQEAMKYLEGQQNVRPSSDEPKKDEFEQEVQKAMQYLKEQEEKNGKPYSIGERIGQFGRGALANYGGISDLAGKGAAYVKEKTGVRIPGFRFYEENPEVRLQEKAPKVIDKLYGRDLSPTDDTGKVISDTGGFFAPLPVPGIGMLAKAKSVAGTIAKSLGAAFGASSAVNLTPRLTEEGTLPGVVEDIGKSILGMKAAGKAPDVAKSIGKAAAFPIKAAISPIKTGEDLAAKGLARFVKPDEKLLGLAEKHNVKVPFNVGADSHFLDFVANNYLKSMFASEAYTESLKHSNQSMVNAVKRSLDTLGEQNLTPNVASDAMREQLKAERASLQSESSKLYGVVRKSIKNEAVQPKNVLKSLRSEEMTELLNNPFLNDESRRVVEKISKIKDRLDGGIINEETIKKQYPNMTETQRKNVLKQIENRGTIPVKDLLSLRKYLLSSIDYNPEVYGIERFLSKLSGSVDKDIRSMSNKDALENYLSANRFYYQNIASRFKNSMAKSLMKGDRPTEAYNLMNSVQNVREMAKVSGKDSKSIQVFNALKKAKAREIIGSAVEGDLKGETILRTGPFGKLFQKGEKRNELLEELLGKKEYNNLCEIGEISDSFSKHGRNLLNTSGTSHVASDFDVSKNTFNAALKTIEFIVNGGAGAAGYAFAGTPGAIAGVAIPVISRVSSPYVISRLVSNEKFVNKAREYARARMAGKEKVANRILDGQLLPITVREFGRVKVKEDQNEE